MYLSLSLVLSLTCLLMYPALSHSGDPGHKHLSKCRDPKGMEGDTSYDGCTKKTCIHAKGTRGVWAESDATDICCAQNGTMYETGTTIQESYPEPCQMVSLQCQLIDDKASIVPELTETCTPPYEVIGDKVDALSEKIDEMMETLEGECTPTPPMTPPTTPPTANQGVLIVGGYNSGGPLNSAEEFNANTGQTCSVGNLPQSNFAMSLCHRMVCGGWYTLKSCSRFEADSTFSTLPVTLREKRYVHLCWGLPSGEVLLLGGYYSRRTTERVSADGSSSSPDFDLPYDTYGACGIDLGGSYVVTGGHNGSTMQTVAQYSVTGEVSYLADLTTGRRGHACSKFVDDNGDTTLLVTGGWDTSNNFLSTTEIYVHSTWSYVSSLPSPRAYFPAATADNVVYVFGGQYDNGTIYYFDEILSYNSNTNIWEIAGQMKEPKGAHAVSPLADLSGSCSSSPIAKISELTRSRVERWFNNSILHGEEGNELYKDKNLHDEEGNEFNEN